METADIMRENAMKVIRNLAEPVMIEIIAAAEAGKLSIKKYDLTDEVSEYLKEKGFQVERDSEALAPPMGGIPPPRRYFSIISW